MDAAVAMIFANSLTEPGATSLGGASFMTIYLKETGEYICIEAMETAPAAAGIDTLDEINEKKGAMLVTVPGQVHGALTALEKYGTMTREEALAELEQPPYDPQQMEEDKAYIAKKLGLTVEEFQTIIDGENKTFRDYRNSWGLIQFGTVVLRALGVEKKKFR